MFTKKLYTDEMREPFTVFGIVLGSYIPCPDTDDGELIGWAFIPNEKFREILPKDMLEAMDKCKEEGWHEEHVPNWSFTVDNETRNISFIRDTDEEDWDDEDAEHINIEYHGDDIAWGKLFG
jgi:hypothetical protein